ncbi:hypothetical protein [Enhygromyxa salina]|uniref:Uncharacterized protein n=1 Tax=Enhygromyxa salina TaxID=215803 RepID=A0A2S9YJE9_9BACT|nr:hypothetical protein [Enhygromyxa salina]PRQ05237.1 hypothetical protein ENSA7_46870 [Enhygromyxa salina]
MKRVKYVKVATILGAIASLLFSVALWFTGHKDQGVFVGLWVPSILSLGAFALAGWGRKDG